MEKENFYFQGNEISDSPQAEQASEEHKEKLRADVEELVTKAQADYESDPDGFMEAFGGDIGWMERGKAWLEKRDEERPYTSNQSGNA